MEELCGSCIMQKELSVLYDIANLMSGSRDIVKSLENSILALKNSLELENCVIYKLDNDILSVFASLNFNKYQKALSSYRLGEGATGVAAESKEPIVVENIHNKDRKSVV